MSRWALGAMAVIEGLLGACGPRSVGPEPAAVPAPPAEARATDAMTSAVVLVALDGVRWQEVFAGVDAALARKAGLGDAAVVPADRLLPNIHRQMIRGGMAFGAPGHGAPVQASGPAFLSLPGYEEMMTGRAASRCASNTCEGVTTRTLADDFRALAREPREVAVLSSWNMIERASALSPLSVVVSAGQKAGATRSLARVSPVSARLLDEGANALNWPGGDGYRPDRFTAPLALDYLETVHPRFLFVGLGDPDEHAHHKDYAGYLGALRFADDFVGQLFALLDRLGDYGSGVTVILTTDHGRAANFHSHGHSEPESARIFVLAAGASIPPSGYVAAQPGRTLSSVASTIRALAGLGASPQALDEPWRLAGEAPPWQAGASRLARRSETSPAATIP
jgi:hypothetical protein